MIHQRKNYKKEKKSTKHKRERDTPSSRSSRAGEKLLPQLVTGNQLTLASMKSPLNTFSLHHNGALQLDLKLHDLLEYLVA
jgi:hypothetical protein